MDRTVVVGDVAAGRYALQRLEDRATLTAVVHTPSGLWAASQAGLRALTLKP